MSDALDLALFGGFVLLSIALILFRRFHEHETFVKHNELGPTSWGLYSDSPTEPVIVNRQAKRR
jgi:hypothetical protein